MTQTQSQADAANAAAALKLALPQISAALDLIGSDDSGATSPTGAPHDTAAKDNLAASYYHFTEAKVLVDAVAADLATPPATLQLGSILAASATEGTAIRPVGVAWTGGTAPVTISVSGLPAGLSLVSNQITGTPSSVGASTVTVTATDAGSPEQKATTTFQIMVSAVTPPPVTGKPLWGEYHGNTSDPNSSVPIGAILDYGDNNATTFGWSVARLAYMKGRLPIIKLGQINQQQCVAFAQGCVAAGFASPLVAFMWENNQDVWEAWDEKVFTAAGFKAQFLAQCGWCDSVAGFTPTYAWCPNLNQAGNQGAGRTQFDTNPGVGNFKNPIVVAPDGYDNPGDLTDNANIVAQCQAFEANAQQNGMKFYGLLETGDNQADDAKFWTDLLTHAQSAGWKVVTNFAIPTSLGGSFDSTIGPKSIAAVEAFYAS